MKVRELLESANWKYAFIVGEFNPDDFDFLDLHSLHADPSSLKGGSIKLPDLPKTETYLANSAQEMIKILVKYIDEFVGGLPRTSELATDWADIRGQLFTIKDPLLFIDTVVEVDMTAVWGARPAMVINSQGDKSYSFPYW